MVQNKRDPSDAVTDAWVRLVLAERKVVGEIEAELKTVGFPNLSWYDVLLHLKRAPDGRSSPKDIENAVLFEQYNISRLLDRMEVEGLVRRIPFPGDKRRQLVEITEEGRALQRRMWGVYGPAINRFIGETLTEQEARQLAALLLKLMNGKDDRTKNDCS
ncbi:MarR family winged helix-turn-helix transcriptional regulator [Microvirga pakistanensis]|uniref:MarR family winged helix-turn-helix transcriptional regulator n=1 Tax=Microvirga pakistanensis TaxID=1682650 RepID=UPI001FCE737A|nr:MarR family winged helix-turn-helix transcriptional regulator [Microvirga pakistanensis]